MNEIINNDISMLTWLTVVEGNLKAPFSITTSPRCKEGHYSFTWIASLTLDSYFIMLSVKQGACLWYN